ncbi:hypothetical protein BOSE127_140563 [Bosea sp. 127]|nr:hypothetical protein BOSE127_140563 [Bosea sp. 127]
MGIISPSLVATQYPGRNSLRASNKI